MKTQYIVDLGILGDALLEITYTAFAGRPGKTSGPPEHCYPEEPPELEIEKILLIATSVETKTGRITLSTPIDLTFPLATLLEESDDFWSHISIPEEV